MWQPNKRLGVFCLPTLTIQQRHCLNRARDTIPALEEKTVFTHLSKLALIAVILASAGCFYDNHRDRDRDHDQGRGRDNDHREHQDHDAYDRHDDDRRGNDNR